MKKIKKIISLFYKNMLHIAHMNASKHKALISEDADFFKEIFKSNLWENEESLSGPGSTIHATRHLRDNLPVLLNAYKIKKILDLPCGDFNWMKEVNLTKYNYHGADIVDLLIEKNKKNYPHLKFSVINLLEDKLPKVDLIIVRDCLFHFPFSKIKKALSNIKKSKITYLLVTSHTWKNFKNTDIKLGGFRKLNLQMDPINLPCPIDFIVEGNEEPNQQDRCMLLYKCEDLIF
jgi:hypothetical protein